MYHFKNNSAEYPKFYIYVLCINHNTTIRKTKLIFVKKINLRKFVTKLF